MIYSQIYVIDITNNLDKLLDLDYVESLKGSVIQIELTTIPLPKNLLIFDIDVVTYLDSTNSASIYAFDYEDGYVDINNFYVLSLTHKDVVNSNIVSLQISNSLINDPMIKSYCKFLRNFQSNYYNLNM